MQLEAYSAYAVLQSTQVNSLEATEQTKNDAEFIKALKKGDRSAWNELIKQTTRSLLKNAYYLTRNWDLVEDIVQETYCMAFQDIKDFQGNSTLSSWLHSIMHNHMKMLKRTGKIRRLEPLETLTDKEQARFMSPLTVDPEEEASKREIWLHLSKILSPNHFQVFVLSLQMDTQEQIAQTLGIPVNTVRTRLHYARTYASEAYGIDLKSLKKKHSPPKRVQKSDLPPENPSYYTKKNVYLDFQAVVNFVQQNSNHKVHSLEDLNTENTKNVRFLCQANTWVKFDTYLTHLGLAHHLETTPTQAKKRHREILDFGKQFVKNNFI